MGKSVCQNCGSVDIDDDAARGDSVCTRCGTVLAENAIVSEIEFQETGGGGHSMIGQFVSGDAPGKIFMSGLMGGASKESREVTLYAGKKRIMELAGQLRLNQHCVDTAFNFFKMAVARGLTRGRRSFTVSAACLYITCRMEGTPHLLLDFCDVIQVNIFDLGKVFNFLARSLYINVPPTDPCIYVMRFAHCLNFGEKEQDVTMMALRLVQRMKRDWMAIGRRPTGVCGAALLLAAKFYGFNRNVIDIVRVVNIGEAVVRKRLMEFELTASSSLTLEEFPTVDIEQEADPPAFTEGKKKAKQAQTEAEQSRLDALQGELVDTEKEVEEALEKKRKRTKGPYAKFAKSDAQSSAGDNEEADAESFIEEEVLRSVLEEDQTDNESCAGESSVGDLDDFSENPSCSSSLRPPSSAGQYRNLRPTLESLGITKETIVGSMKLDEASRVEDENNDGLLDLNGIDDEELDHYLLLDTEVELKTKIWMAANGEFLEQREKARVRKAEELEKLEKEMAAGGKKPRKRRRATNVQTFATVGDAIEKIVQERKLSSKINYEVLKTLT